MEGEDGRKGASGQQDDLAADIERYVVKIRSISDFRISPLLKWQCLCPYTALLRPCIRI